MSGMKRREFVTLLGGAAALPLAARAQQTAPPVIGLLSSRASSDAPQLLSAIRQGLKETGFAEAQNVTIEYRFAGNRNDRLPALAADLVQRQVNLILATGTAAALAAKEATTAVPIIFEMGSDPIRLGLVASLNRPGGNVTGVTQLNIVVAPKRLELLHELVPAATAMVLFIDPTDPAVVEATRNDLKAAARSLGLELHILNASTEAKFEPVFAKVIELRAGGLVLGALALRYAVPAVYEGHAFVMAGGLASYGSRLTESYRLAGLYTGRVLKGEKPAHLPVQQSTKLEMFLNLKTAKALGIGVPLPLSG